MLIAFALLIFAAAMNAQSESVPQGKVATMGDAENDETTRHKSAKLERYIMQTMALSDCEEVARRAKRLHARYPETAKVVMRRARELQAGENAAKSPDALYQALKRKEPQTVFNLR